MVMIVICKLGVHSMNSWGLCTQSCGAPVLITKVVEVRLSEEPKQDTGQQSPSMRHFSCAEQKNELL